MEKCLLGNPTQSLLVPQRLNLSDASNMKQFRTALGEGVYLSAIKGVLRFVHFLFAAYKGIADLCFPVFSTTLSCDSQRCKSPALVAEQCISEFPLTTVSVDGELYEVGIEPFRCFAGWVIKRMP